MAREAPGHGDHHDGASGASRLSSRTASTPRPLPIAISGASGPSTTARQSVANEPRSCREARSARPGRPCLEALGRLVAAGAGQVAEDERGEQSAERQHRDRPPRRRAAPPEILRERREQELPRLRRRTSGSHRPTAADRTPMSAPQHQQTAHWLVLTICDRVRRGAAEPVPPASSPSSERPACRLHRRHLTRRTGVWSPDPLGGEAGERRARRAAACREPCRGLIAPAGPGSREQEALCGVAAEVGEASRGVVRPRRPRRRRAGRARAAELDRRADDRVLACAGAHREHERAIDLQLVERQVVELAERGPARSRSRRARSRTPISRSGCSTSFARAGSSTTVLSVSSSWSSDPGELPARASRPRDLVDDPAVDERSRRRR